MVRYYQVEHTNDNMGIIDNLKKLERKKLLFEYFVLKLTDWKNVCSSKDTTPFTKLQLQKLLFLASAIGATYEEHKMFDVFNHFYALQYGPVEIDIYDFMNNNGFQNIHFEGNYCKIDNTEIIAGNKDDEKATIDTAVELLRIKNFNYVNMDAFSLVDITHGWSAWQVAITIANLSGNRMERMTTEDIINSTIKTF